MLKNNLVKITLASLLACQTLTISSLSLASAPTTVISGRHDLSGSISYTINQLPKQVDSGLEPYDYSPLGNRTPLILVHGIAAQDDHLFNWARFLSFQKTQSNFTQKYKVYLYHYDSTRSVPDISVWFQQSLRKFIADHNGKPIKILAYSEGGLLTRNALQDPYLDSKTIEVLTIGTPFHGSPLANPEWVAQQVKTEGFFNIIRMSQKIAYKITGKLYPTFKQDFHWDNFDGAIPMKQYIQSNGPVVSREYALAHKAQFITYGSYFGVNVDSGYLAQQLELQKPIPKEKLQFSNVFKRNFMFSLIRDNIGKLPLSSPADSVTTQLAQAAPPVEAKPEPALIASIEKQLPDTVSPAIAMPLVNEAADGAIELLSPPQKISMSANPKTIAQSIHNIVPQNELKHSGTIKPTISMMMYNDGISPISSTLWLGRYTNTLVGTSQPVDKLWATLKTLKGNRNTRLFAGVDHRNWMDGVTRTGSSEVRDLLNPDQNPRTVFEWIIYDLMS